MLYLFWLLFTTPLVEGFIWNLFSSQKATEATPPAVVGEFLISSETTARLEEASEALKALEENNGCWIKQRDFLLERCGEPSHEARSDVANRLTNCQLELNGLRKLRCNKRDPTKCTAQLAADVRSYNVYTNFFMHIDNICHFLKSDEFRHSTLRTVQQLYDATVDTGKTLHEWSTKSEKMLLNLGEMQEKNHEQLNNIESTQGEILGTQREMKHITKETVAKVTELKQIQMESIEEVLSLTGKLREDLLFILNGITFDLEEIKTIDNEILRNIFHVHTLIFYSLSFFLFWFMTSNVRTHGCRYRTYCMLCVGVWLEMKFSDLYLSIRALVFGLNLIILCVECWSYTDLIAENNALLKKLLVEREQPSIRRRPICGIKLSMMGKLYGNKKSFHYEY